MRLSGVQPYCCCCVHVYFSGHAVAALLTKAQPWPRPQVSAPGESGGGGVYPEAELCCRKLKDVIEKSLAWSGVSLPVKAARGGGGRRGLSEAPGPPAAPSSAQ